MRGEEAKQVCPQIQLVQVPVARGKADLNTYRNAGSEVLGDLILALLFVSDFEHVIFFTTSDWLNGRCHGDDVQVVSILARKVRCERASIDEVYLDLTDAAEKMLAEAPPENLQLVDEETLKSHVLGLNDEVDTMFFFSIFVIINLLIDQQVIFLPKRLLPWWLTFFFFSFGPLFLKIA